MESVEAFRKKLACLFHTARGQCISLDHCWRSDMIHLGLFWEGLVLVSVLSASMPGTLLPSMEKLCNFTITHIS